MRSEKAKRLTRAEKAELQAKMQRMVDEANSLRDEAAEKMYGIPKGYKLNTTLDDAKFYLTTLLYVVLAFAFLAAFRWSINEEHAVVSMILTFILCIGMLAASAAKNRPYHADESVKDFYVNDAWCGELSEELNRLKTGIESYDRQYAEQEEDIAKFRQYTYKISEVLGQSGDLDLVLKAYDFHAVLKLEAGEEKVNLRLAFNEADYNQMDALVRQFSLKRRGYLPAAFRDEEASCADM